MGFSTNRYLFAIRTLHEKYLCVRAVDVAHYLGFAKPSVSISIRQMREQGLIEVEPDGNILFTESGKTRAESLNRRVSFFRQLLTDAGGGAVARPAGRHFVQLGNERRFF